MGMQLYDECPQPKRRMRSKIAFGCTSDSEPHMELLTCRPHAVQAISFPSYFPFGCCDFLHMEAVLGRGILRSGRKAQMV